MTDNVTAAQPQNITAPPATAHRRYTESLSLFVDPITRAFTLGRAVELARANEWRTPRESEVIRSMLDAAIQQEYADDPEAYAAAVAVGRAEMDRRKAESTGGDQA